MSPQAAKLRSRIVAHSHFMGNPMARIERTNDKHSRASSKRQMLREYVDTKQAHDISSAAQHNADGVGFSGYGSTTQEDYSARDRGTARGRASGKAD